ncbi:MAG TPA: asparaginase [Actinomycetota bacterium]|nr:asparaginase [Actinomycetota bacterium]
MPPVPLVRVVRSGVEESVHLGSVVVADADGRILRKAGDPSRVAFARSSMKPLQAAVSLRLAAADPSDPEVAVMCASHNGEPVHVDAVTTLLRRAGLDEHRLQTPPDRPIDPESASAVEEPRPIFHNCSGKHAGMLLASTERGFDTGTYRDPDHPLQRAVLDTVEGAAGHRPEAIGVDGCGVPVHALPLAALAKLYAALGAGRVDLAERVLAAMRAEPYLVAGRNRVCTAVMEAAPNVVVKTGAEGLMCAAILDRGIGVALKVEDGAARAADPAIVRALALIGTLDPDAVSGFARPPVLGGGRPVGHLEASFHLPAA